MFSNTNEALDYIQGYKTLKTVEKVLAIRKCQYQKLSEKAKTIETLDKRMRIATKIQFCNEAIAGYKLRSF